MELRTGRSRCVKWFGKQEVAPSQIRTPPECDNPSCHVHNCKRSLTQPAIISVNQTVKSLLLSVPYLSSSKHNQQDATLYNILYYCQCCTCFGRFFHPSSAAQKLYMQHRVCASSKQTWHKPDAACTVFELLMTGGKPAPNKQSIDSNKEYCITLDLVGYT